MKAKIVYSCTQCAATFPKWMGKCNDCGAWNTLVEDLQSVSTPASNLAKHLQSQTQSRPVPLPDVQFVKERRFSTRIGELDRVLGGGVVPGSLILLSGDPGIGKSTLLLQTLHQLGLQGHKVLYASGEESASQIKLRAERLETLNPSIFIINENNLANILDSARSEKPSVLVIDSIQTVSSPLIPGSPGGVSQIRECTNQLVDFAKSHDIATFLVGHVTKEGGIAGPKVLEHLVDSVLYLEGQEAEGHRILRSVKNRFGSTGEIGVFEMKHKGLAEVLNPSSLFLGEHQEGIEGSAVGVSVEGSRPLLTEIQVLVGKTSFASPRRICTGIDTNRFTILLAVLEKRAGMNLSAVDVYANVTGGIKILEPAIDLATAAAVCSSFFGKPLPPKTAYFGEVGLSGEVRITSHALPRIQEAMKLGFQRVFLPYRNYQQEKDVIQKVVKQAELEFELCPVENVKQLMKKER